MAPMVTIEVYLNSNSHRVLTMDNDQELAVTHEGNSTIMLVRTKMGRYRVIKLAVTIGEYVPGQPIETGGVSEDRFVSEAEAKEIYGNAEEKNVSVEEAFPG